MKQTKNLNVLFGYIPFTDFRELSKMAGKGQAMGRDSQQRQNYLDKIGGYLTNAQDKMPDCKGLLWSIERDDDKANNQPEDYSDLEKGVKVIFLYDNSSKKLYDHMLTWAENDHSRFRWFIKRHHDDYTKPSPYSMGIISDPKKSIDRFIKTQSLVHHDQDDLVMTEDDDFKVLSVPITSNQLGDNSLTQGGPDMARYIFEDLTRISVGFIDTGSIIDDFEEGIDMDKYMAIVDGMEWLNLDRIDYGIVQDNLNFN